MTKPAVKPQESPAPASEFAKGLEVLKDDAGTWDAEVSLWLRPGSEPIRSRAIVTAQMAVGGMYLAQRFEGTFGPEMGNKTWSTLSYTNFNATTFPCVLREARLSSLRRKPQKLPDHAERNFHD